ncbi:MAG: histidine kinase [Eubacterium sp.]|nr:histidine kinase [Eubacterium sp.]
MQDTIIRISQKAAISLINQSSALISIVLMMVVFVVAFNIEGRSQRIRYYLVGISINIGGLMFQIASYTSYAYVFYALVIPAFTLYFVETERSENETWDGNFWMSLQSLEVVLIIMMVAWSGSSFFISLSFLVQYLIVISMLLISSKKLSTSIGFLLGSSFPVFTSFIGMVYPGLYVQGFGVTMFLLIIFFGYQSDMEQELLNKRVELSENKVSLLMEQIHPHFIYNALQQIALLSDEDSAKVKPAIQSFSMYLRKNFEALTNEKMIPFLVEMEHVNAYVELSQILPSRNFTLKNDFQVEDFYLPALTIQPLVENAIYYGIGMSEEGDEIRLETRLENGYIVITVADDGHGAKTEISTQKKHKSVGTKNVKTRLKLLCDGELTIEKSENGTKSIIKIPQNRAVSQEK